MYITCPGYSLSWRQHLESKHKFADFQPNESQTCRSSRLQQDSSRQVMPPPRLRPIPPRHSYAPRRHTHTTIHHKTERIVLRLYSHSTQQLLIDASQSRDTTPTRNRRHHYITEKKSSQFNQRTSASSSSYRTFCWTSHSFSLLSAKLHQGHNEKKTCLCMFVS